jgi:hypothetical protein
LVVSLSQTTLDSDGTFDSIDHARNLDQHKLDAAV